MKTLSFTVGYQYFLTADITIATLCVTWNHCCFLAIRTFDIFTFDTKFFNWNNKYNQRKNCQYYRKCYWSRIVAGSNICAITWIPKFVLRCISLCNNRTNGYSQSTASNNYSTDWRRIVFINNTALLLLISSGIFAPHEGQKLALSLIFEPHFSQYGIKSPITYIILQTSI